MEAWVARKSPLGTGELISPTDFPWVSEPEANRTTIRHEMGNVLMKQADLPAIQDPSPVQYNIVREKVWKVFAFSAYGTWCGENCRVCPQLDFPPVLI